MNLTVLFGYRRACHTWTVASQGSAFMVLYRVLWGLRGFAGCGARVLDSSTTRRLLAECMIISTGMFRLHKGFIRLRELRVDDLGGRQISGFGSTALGSGSSLVKVFRIVGFRVKRQPWHIPCQ